MEVCTVSIYLEITVITLNSLSFRTVVPDKLMLRQRAYGRKGVALFGLQDKYFASGKTTELKIVSEVQSFIMAGHPRIWLEPVPGTVRSL